MAAAPLSSPPASSTSAMSTGRHLAASASESALVARATSGNRAQSGLPPPPPAQPKRVRPFILRAKTADSTAADSAARRGPAHLNRAADQLPGRGQLRKSQTSFDLEARAASPTQPRRSRRDAVENVPPLPVSKSPPARAKRIARPISLATNSLRAIGNLSSTSSSSSGNNTSGGRAAASKVGITKRRPLSYVVSSSSPPRTRTLAATNHSPSTSPNRTRTLRMHTLPESPSPSRRSWKTSAAAAADTASTSSTASRMSALPPPTSATTTSTTATPRAALASPPHAVKTQSRHAAVELHKSALKRKTLEERQQQARGTAAAATSTSLEPYVNSAGANEGSPTLTATSGGGLTRSRRWFGKLESADEDAFAQEQVSTRAPAVTHARSHLDDSASAATQRELDAYATPRAPVARKKASYAALPVLPGREAELTAAAGHQSGYASLQDLLEQHGYADTRVITPHSTTQTARIRSAMADDLRKADFGGYGQEGLDAADNDNEEVEVLASPLANRTRPRSTSPGPHRLPAATARLVPREPAKEIKERPSLLSLRGLFSFFGSGAVDVEEDLATSSPRLEQPDEANSSPPPLADVMPGPRSMRTVSDMHRWVETVNEVYPTLPPAPAPQPVQSHLTPIPASTTSSSTAIMPELHFEHTADRSDNDDDDADDAASCRSYSSSISFSGSPPTPQPVFGGVDYAVMVAPSSFSGDSHHHHHHHHLSPPMLMHDADVPRNKRLSLRHTVSDSNLLPAYQSFAGLGISAPSPPPRPSPGTAHGSQLSVTKPGSQVGLATAGGSSSAVAIMAAHALSSGGGGTGLWGTTALRARASQLFSLAMARSPVDAATGRSFLNMPPTPASTGTSSFPSSAAPGPSSSSSASAAAARRAPPRLLRKAVSSGGLVSAPQVRRTRVVAKASWESFGSLEAKVSLDGGRPGSAASNGGGDADLDGGIGWGEDLLGRAWA
ncbi:hypothetical protein JCM3774_002161 [Rhodotorula dairenensis]